MAARSQALAVEKTQADGALCAHAHTHTLRRVHVHTHIHTHAPPGGPSILM